MYREIATALYKRGDTSMPTEGHQMPSWGGPVVFLTVVLFIPLLLIYSYTVQQIYPTLAIIEDPAPPAYEPVSLNDDSQAFADDSGRSSAPPITSSLRGTHRALYARGGFSAMFRGYWCNVFLNIATAFIATVFLGIGIPAFIAVPIIGVTLVQPFAAWTHIVISTPSSQWFWQRFPPFTRTFKATALPMALYLVAAEVAASLPRGLARLLNISTWNYQNPNTIPDHDKHDLWKGIVIFVVALALQVFLVIPAQATLTRVQASFLPEDHDTIVPFDRSFGGKVEPAVVGGKGYISMAEAWKSFSRESWIRLVKLYVKIFFVGIGLFLTLAAVLIPEYLLIMAHSTKNGDEL
ncbi:ubiquitin carrier protein [Xylariaceae sp. FL1272]|nr:ubiquitin carrier protein [Xylariaceae sp. FL1272]